MTTAVPSGVASRGPTPVPPDVTMRRAPAASARRSADSTLSAPSATIVASRHAKPARRSASTATGPETSARSPRADRSETVITAAVSGEAGMHPLYGARRSSRMTIDLDVGVPLPSATESSGTSTFVSG